MGQELQVAVRAAKDSHVACPVVVVESAWQLENYERPQGLLSLGDTLLQVVVVVEQCPLWNVIQDVDIRPTVKSSRWQMEELVDVDVSVYDLFMMNQNNPSTFSEELRCQFDKDFSSAIFPLPR
ncbi:hypothetical protein RRG08_021783 [Elysia crispata]|uniref:Uncharacterized protein n=1 Tax=Elysia crispata TaxID=231223 RepID=A0AAE0ZZY1_9GAST|nr:hypothetical protein RRG08_021783 [Elysia crispata]